MVVLSNFSAPLDGIVHQEVNTLLSVNGKDVGTGTLYITENAVIWGNSNASVPALSIAYRSICLHGMQSTPTPALFMQLDYVLDIPGVTSSEENRTGAGDTVNTDDDDDDGFGGPSTQLHFMPTNTSSLQAMYEAMNECQALHPDPLDEDDSDYMEGEEDGEEDEEMHDAIDEQEDNSDRLQDIHLNHNNGANGANGNSPEDEA